LLVNPGKLIVPVKVGFDRLNPEIVGLVANTKLPVPVVPVYAILVAQPFTSVAKILLVVENFVKLFAAVEAKSHRSVPTPRAALVVPVPVTVPDTVKCPAVVSVNLSPPL
jgi:hypothetical protein